ncbi:2-amino-4-hydroxy-6-hydroxymethyldihydropteridine diphosphokinase [Methylomonas sp. EFPC3]|uniref:2-amino-4-hydroxy-6- hydroxymethyldihydropteridine diphosphokinase n=1 Tax=Methylomonas sp. EFPC3 TaxID=3021710 RepID=UPI002417F9E2|nr:2-amino-4-hydroxy-6-hydroxymethyldihydropteridine diphosphokinase [Methylomonas sp. EFPC3]WFP49637.1 2-amino-4-hydroxy-6-hydroxymethyldihydropteridine diphosphokinase [Methylomonas sp. EFPC3]
MTALNPGVEAYIGLGSNLDNPVEQLKQARTEIATLAGVAELAFSSLYLSTPVGPQDQPDFVNAVMKISTSLAAAELLSQLQAIETAHGRLRLVRWGARTLDLDILLYGASIITEAQLVVPHPEMAKRGFVLYPLADIAPADLPIPGFGPLADLLAACPQAGLQRLEP